ncbi:MAG: formate dehydrogenase subunit delta [Pseudomonadota bacterium]
MNPQEHLVYMANQIARNFAIMGREDAAAATADHIATFWDPRMKAALQSDQSGIDEIAGAALRILADGGRPPHQTDATRTVIDGSDAG